VIYYDLDGITIHHANCADVMVTPSDVALLLTDPPYGIAYKSSATRSVLATSRAAVEIVGDDKPFDPSWLLQYPRIVLWGANHYADKLPPSSSWVVWDKLNGLTSDRDIGFNDSSDCELAWTNIGGPARIFSHRWIGMLRDSERDRTGWHPTQKPVALMSWILRAWTKPGDLVYDPYMGSGPVAEACHLAGRRYVGVEMNEGYCEKAASRLAQGVLDIFANV
jgi:site-specific DNA-methyltransferase (adenine-specific)/modification methylase